METSPRSVGRPKGGATIAHEVQLERMDLLLTLDGIIAKKRCAIRAEIDELNEMILRRDQIRRANAQVAA